MRALRSAGFPALRHVFDRSVDPTRALLSLPGIVAGLADVREMPQSQSAYERPGRDRIRRGRQGSCMGPEVQSRPGGYTADGAVDAATYRIRR